MAGECSRLQQIVNNSIASCWSTARPQLNQAITDIYNLVCVAASDTCVKEVPPGTPIANFVTLGWAGVPPTPAECPLLYIIRGLDVFIAVNNGAVTEASWCQLCTADACSVVLPPGTPPSNFASLGWGGTANLPLQSECPVLFVMEGCNVWIAPNNPASCDFVGGTAWVLVTPGGVAALVWDDIPTMQTDRGAVINWLDGKGTTALGEVHQVNLADDLSAVSGSFATVAGGSDQTASGDYSFVGAGLTNQVSGAKGAVVAGTLNVVAGENAAVVAGSTNTPQAQNSFIGAGFSNDIDPAAQRAAIVAGNNNSVSVAALDGFGGAGINNIISGLQSAVVAGSGSTASGENAFVGAGSANVASGARAAVVAGDTNTPQAPDSFIGGGFSNDIAPNANKAVIVGGNNNGIGASASEAFIGAGQQNNIGTVAFRAAIVNGGANTINNNASESFIGSGSSNQISGSRAFIGAGTSNQANGLNAAVVAGNNNVAGTSRAVVVGGQFNTNNSINGVILGGESNTINNGADHAMIVGHMSTIGTNARWAVSIGRGNDIGASADDAIAIGQNADHSIPLGILIGGTTNKVGFFGTTPKAQQAGIADPSGGATIDSQARTAIIAVITALEQYGLLATV